jgi:hypothetical protein
LGAEQVSLDISILLFCAVAIIASIWMTAPKHSHKPASVLQEDASQQPSNDFSALIYTIREQGEAYRKEEKNEEREKRIRDWVTICILAFTLIALTATYCAISEQVSEMKKVYSPIKDATDATKRQLAELIADRRPFVGVEPSEIIINKPLSFDTQGASMNFDLLFRNTGKSAAISTTSLGSELIITPLEVFSDSTHINYCNKDNAADFTSVGTIILPGGRSKYHINSIVPRTHFQFDPSGLVSAWFRLCLEDGEEGCDRPDLLAGAIDGAEFFI